MEKLTEKILHHLEPDRNKWTQMMMARPMDPPSQASCILQAAERIGQAMKNQEKVMVCGDYDADGILASAILVDALQRMGIQTGFYIPDRVRDGYGLQPETVRLAKEKGYGLLVTVDNGVRQTEALQAAREEGLDVIVTDHHAMDELPDADWVVHPGLMEPSFFSLSGAGVAYELVRVLGLEDRFSLQLAGIASVADMMQVQGQTRSIIQQAVKSMNACVLPHVRALHAGPYDETVIGFQIAPVLNAPGRMCHLANANNVVRWLLDRDPVRIQAMADQIRKINAVRKQETKRLMAAVMEEADSRDNVLFACSPDYAPGLVGLAAGNLSRTYAKPAVAGCVQGDKIVCSMRAPAGFDCQAFLAGFDGFEKAGGHASAAGFTLPLDQEQAFRAYVRTCPVPDVWPEKPQVSVLAQEISLQALQELDRLRPFGPGFEMPLLRIEYPQVISTMDLSLGTGRRYTLNTGLHCLRFGISEKEKAITRIRAMSGTAQLSAFRGRTDCSFMIEKIEPI